MATATGRSRLPGPVMYATTTLPFSPPAALVTQAEPDAATRTSSTHPVSTSVTGPQPVHDGPAISEPRHPPLITLVRWECGPHRPDVAGGGHDSWLLVTRVASCPVGRRRGSVGHNRLYEWHSADGPSRRGRQRWRDRRPAGRRQDHLGRQHEVQAVRHLDRADDGRHHPGDG